MFFKKSFLIVLFEISLFLLFSCASRPSPQEVAQFNLDINNGNIEAVKKTLKKHRNILNIGYENFDSSITYPIHMAIISNNPDMVKLTANKSTVNILIKPVMCSPLYFALALNRNSEIIKILIDEGADVNFIDKRTGLSVFHEFAANPPNKDVWKILRKYATAENLNHESINKATPVSCLITSQLNGDDLDNPNEVYLLKDFIEHGGNPNYLINFKEYAIAAVNYLRESNYYEYKQVLLNGMKNNPPVGDSEKLIELLENGK